jgi:hypothetical protein
MPSVTRAVFLLLCALALPLAASDELTARWSSTLNATAAEMAGGSFQPAVPRLRKLIREVLEKLGPGPEADRFFANVLTQLALAEAGTGQLADAQWHWQTAQNVFPSIGKADLSAFGAAGQLLSKHILEPRASDVVCPKLPDGSLSPTVLVRKEPKYPEGLRQFRTSGIVIFEVHADETGNVIEARVMKPLPGPMIHTSMEALREWKYAPVVVDGNAVPAKFCTTFYFKLVK